MLKKVVKSKDNTYNDLDELLYKAEEYLDSDLIQKQFNYSTLEEMLEYLSNTRGTYKNGARVSVIKNRIRDLKNEIRQMHASEINDRRPDVIVNLVEKILDAIERQLLLGASETGGGGQNKRRGLEIFVKFNKPGV